MNIDKKTIRSSPFIGVFCVVTDKHTLIPTGIEEKERKGLDDLFQTEVIETSLAGSGLLGVLCIGNSKGYCVSNIVEEKELTQLQEQGLKVKQLSSVDAVGNLVEVNDSLGLCSAAIPKKTKIEIEKTLGISLHHTLIAGSDIVGSAMVLTNNGFLVHPNTSDAEAAFIEKTTGLEGEGTTANQGDHFIGNSIIANSNGAMVGTLTTGHELLRIDEGLRGHD
jgi:translation initiation factor 6